MNIHCFYIYIIILCISSITILILYALRKLQTCVYATIPISLINESIYDSVLYSPIIDQMLLLINMLCLSSAILHILTKKYAVLALVLIGLIQFGVAITITFLHWDADILLLPSLLLVWILGAAKLRHSVVSKHWQVRLAINYSFTIAVINSLHYCIHLLYQELPYTTYITNSLLLFYTCMLICVLFILSTIFIKNKKIHV